MTYLTINCEKCKHPRTNPYGWRGFYDVMHIPCSKCGYPLEETLRHIEDRRKAEEVEREMQRKFEKENEWSVDNVLRGRFGLTLSLLMHLVYLVWIGATAYIIVGFFWYFLDSDSAPSLIHYLVNIFKKT